MKTGTITASQSDLAFGIDQRAPVLLVAWAPAASRTVDRCLVKGTFTVGRATDCDFSLRDPKASGRHMRITHREDEYLIEDLGSKNGTYVNGERIHGRSELASPSVIRVGQAVLVFLDNGGATLVAPLPERFGMAGRFHRGPLLRGLFEAANSARHLLITGPSGSGKELAARATVQMLAKDGVELPLVVHNAARFASEEEAATTLFGVADRVFSGVSARPGLIEQAHGGALFLDEVHNLPERVQRSLLRVIEDKQLSRIGETKNREADVRFILASNVDNETRGLADDLFARLRVVDIPPLSERVADIPSIFLAVLSAAMERSGLNEETLTSLLNADHYEAMCLDGFPTSNVRGLVDLTDRLVTRVTTGSEASQALTSIFAERFGLGPVAERHRDAASPAEEDSKNTHYHRNKEAIIAAFEECKGNLSATERLLRSRGIQSTRRWIGFYAEKWGIK